MTEGTIPSILAKQDWPRIIGAALGYRGGQERELCKQLKTELRSNGIECGSPTIPSRRLLVDIGPKYPSEKEWPFVIEVKFFRTRKNHSMRTKEAGSLIFDFVKVALCPAKARYVLLVTDQEMKNYLQNNIPELLSGQQLPITFPDLHIAASYEAIVDESRFSIIVYSVITK